MDPSLWCSRCTSRKGSFPSDSFSSVNCILVSMEFRCSRDCWQQLAGNAVHISSPEPDGDINSNQGPILHIFHDQVGLEIPLPCQVYGLEIPLPYKGVWPPQNPQKRRPPQTNRFICTFPILPALNTSSPDLGPTGWLLRVSCHQFIRVCIFHTDTKVSTRGYPSVF